MSDAHILDKWLSKFYHADLHGRAGPVLAEFKTAVANDAGLLAEAQRYTRQTDELIATRGRGACAYSAKYNDFLHEVLDARG